jgi:hypothetical protein
MERNKRKVRNASFIKELSVLPTGDLLSAIEVSLTKKENPLQLVRSLWHGYMTKKYMSMSPLAYERKDALDHLTDDINYIRALFTDLIGNLYRDWIKYLNNEQPMDEEIEYEVLP